MKYLLKKNYSTLLKQPQNKIYHEIKAVYKDAFADNERILFVDDVAQSPERTYLKEYLDKLLAHLDIDPFFVTTIYRGNQTVWWPTNYNIPDTVCMTPWVGLEVDVDSTLHRCCLWDRSLGEKQNSFRKFFKSTKQSKLKNEFLKGNKPAECSKCWKIEQAGGESKRQHDNFTFREHKFAIDYNDTKSDQILNLDIKLGNKCNLACRICSPRCSSTWSKYDDAVDVKFDWLQNDSSKFWQDISAISKDVKYITFAGGEPLLDKTHRNLLQYFISNKLSKDIVLHYNTNGTVYADYLFDYWNHFKSVELSFSIDNVDKQFEYERYGMNWSVVNTNLKKYSTTQYVKNIYCTVTALNVMYLKKVFDYAESLDYDITFSMLSDPEELAITNLPDAVKQKVVDRLQNENVEKFKKLVDPICKLIISKEKISNVLEYLKPQDSKRAQRFGDYYPELYSEIEKCQ